MYGVLSDPDMPRGLLLDTIRHVETGGSPNPNYAMGSASELGAYQMRTDMLHDLGFGMPRNIDPFQLMDPNKSRDLAGQFIDSYSSHYSFDTPIEKIIAYNMGAPATSAWKARGSNYDELPQITKNYIRKALSFANNQPAKENNMLQYTAMQRIEDNMPANEQPVQSTPAEVQPQMNMQDIQNQVAATVAKNKAARDAQQQQDNLAYNMVDIPAIVGQQPQRPITPAAATMLANVQKNAPGILAQQNANQNAALYNNLDNYVLAGTHDTNSNSNPNAYGRPYGVTVPQAEPVLSQDPMSDGLITTSSPKTMNTDQARKQTPFSLPDQRIGRDEALIRIGGAMMGGSQQGGLAALQAATDQYGSIQDYNRSQALDAYNAAVKAAGKQAANPNADASSAYQQSTINSIDEVVSLLDSNQDNWNPFDNVAGLLGSLNSYRPGSPAFDVDKMLDTIKANVGFDRLQAMRDSSPTGGALGQVTELELKLLQSSLAALDQGMSPKRFREQLMIVRDQYMKVTGLLAQDPALQGGKGGLSIQVDPTVQSLIDQYAQ